MKTPRKTTAAQLIVLDEDPAEYTTLLESLTAEYQPETEMQQSAVAQAARAIWNLARVNRGFDKSQQNLYQQQADMHEWNAAQRAEFERLLRYRTRAERAHGRAFHEVEFLRKLNQQAHQRVAWAKMQDQRLSLAKQRLKLSTTRREPKEPEKVTRSIDQWIAPVVPVAQVIEIRLLDGVISQRVYPEIDDMHRRADRASPEAAVIRSFEFPDGVPAEYAWLNEPGIVQDGIIRRQSFKRVQDWRAHVAGEAAIGPHCYLPKRHPI